MKYSVQRGKLTAFYFEVAYLGVVRIVLEVHRAGEDQSQSANTI